MTRAERVLWARLRDRQLDGCKFVRQEPVGPYFGDFVCRARRLVVEVDGGQHSDSPADRRRDADLAALGYRLARFWNNDVLHNIDGVIETLRLTLNAPHPVPLPARGEREPGGDHQSTPADIKLRIAATGK